MNIYAQWIKVAGMILCAGMALSSCAGMPRSSSLEQEGSAETPYLLGPDDMVKVTTEQHPEWSGDYIVGPDGKIAIAGLGSIEVEGLSKPAAEKKIMRQAEKYINNPRVSVDIVKYASQVVYVLGEVNKPGKYPTEGKRLTLRDAAVLAGLPTRFAADDRVYIISPSRKKPGQQVVNLYRILYKGEMKRNIELEPGDIVFVPQNFYGMLNDFFNIFSGPFSTAQSAVAVP